MTNRGLIVDLDNTLYDWFGAFSPSFREMVATLTRELGLPEEEIFNDFAAVYKQREAVEYPKAVEELPLWERHGVSADKQRTITSLANKVFRTHHENNLELFPNVAKVLRQAKDEGLVIIGLSDSFEQWAAWRLEILGIEEYFDGLYSRQNPWENDRAAIESPIRKRVQLHKRDLKPNPHIIDTIVCDFALSRKKTVFVGDSLSRDILTAQRAGIRDVWARYGTKHKEEDLDTVRRITPWTPEEKTAEERAHGDIVPTTTIDDFGELTGLLMGQQELALF